MKQKIVALAAAMGLAASINIYASGIPTVDIAAVTQMAINAAAQAQQALDALNTAKEGIEQAREQYEHYKSLVEGNDMLGGFLNDPALNKLFPMGDWAEVYSSARDIERMRERYGLKSDDEDVQAKFDQMLAVADAWERSYEASTQRVRNAEQLRAKLDQAITPQQKEDLNLRFQQEFLEIQNQQARLEHMKYLSEQDALLKDQSSRLKFSENMKVRRTF